MADAVDYRCRIAHGVGSVRRELYTYVRTSAALPTDVGHELPGLGYLDSNILDEQAQHALAILGLCAGSMP